MKAELVLIPGAGIGHLTPALELAKLLVARSQTLSITVLIMKVPHDSNLAAYTDSLAASFASERINFVDISGRTDPSADASETNPFVFYDRFIESHRSLVRRAVVSAAGAPRPGLAGFVIDFACTPMADVAGELGVPAYIFFPASAGFLALCLHHVSVDLKADVSFPGFGEPVPRRVLPSMFLNASAQVLRRIAMKIRGARGVVVNTSAEIEPHALRFLAGDAACPPLYAVGPVLNLPASGDESAQAFSGSPAGAVMAWLDGQPRASVLFLCFGSVGSLPGEQVREIAAAIESAGVRFLWTLRLTTADDDDKPALSSDVAAVLPEGFLERTAGAGRVIGWAPQAAVLAHPAVGGFVSHCGWNSVLESLWFGVPVAAWPLFGEQQLNAFKIVAELGLAAEVKMDYRFGFDEDDGGAVALVGAEVIEAAIRKVMEGQSEIRRRVKEMSAKCRNAVADGGSYFSSLDRFLSDVFENFN